MGAGQIPGLAAHGNQKSAARNSEFNHTEDVAVFSYAGGGKCLETLRSWPPSPMNQQASYEEGVLSVWRK